jgi:hypothetical protein
MKCWELEDKIFPGIFGSHRVNPTNSPGFFATHYIPGGEFQMVIEIVPHSEVYENGLHTS